MILSVNILTWNTINPLRATLKVLEQELEGIESEIIIVDNGSKDGCQDLATIKNPVNLGISKGKNQGVDASRGEFIMMVDGDVVPVPNSIRCLLAYMELNPECDAIGFLPDKFCQHPIKEGGHKCHEEYCEKLEPVKVHNGHCIYYGMYRRRVFDKVRFDEQYGVGYGYEDLDSWMQMQQHGIIQYAAGINHLCGKYFHAINSSINNKDCLGFEEYMRTSMKRSQIFKKKWERVHVIHPDKQPY